MPNTWRELLGEIIKDPGERARLAEALDINPVTINRWVQGNFRPRPKHLYALVEALPDYRQEFMTLIAQEFGRTFLDFFNEQVSDIEAEIPSNFYSRIFSAYTATPRSLRSITILTLILQQMLSHLDPSRKGMAITVVRCVKPVPGRKVRTLHEVLGRGNPPWPSHIESQPLLLGAISLVGSAVSSLRLVANQNLKEDNSFHPSLRMPGEMSGVACPFVKENCVAGAVLVVSTQPDYFPPPVQEIVQNYANAMTLAFEADEFYPQANIELALLPPPQVQAVFFADFQKHVRKILSDAMSDGYALTRDQAEELVWHELEDALIAENIRLLAQQ
ncbi:MAG TPA: helix-turn-helix transcriptional regulator [Ktedonobacteraceae bacterium]|jgi:transcriptional regulator with XRE-family HTH domain|nr:helix-turn-helix transcriptional regulator [Ktedonobacteraceae bacterium]